MNIDMLENNKDKTRMLLVEGAQPFYLLPLIVGKNLW